MKSQNNAVNKAPIRYTCCQMNIPYRGRLLSLDARGVAWSCLNLVTQTLLIPHGRTLPSLRSGWRAWCVCVGGEG